MATEPAIAIRRAQSDDIPKLCEVCAKTLRACYTPFLGRTRVEAWIANEMDGFFRDHSDDIWVATDGASTSGCCIVTGQLLVFLLVDVDEHRRGVGTLLTTHAEDLVFRDYDEIRLESFVDNHRANAFYEKRGWIKDGRHLDAKSGVDVWEFNKRRALPDTS